MSKFFSFSMIFTIANFEFKNFRITMVELNGFKYHLMEAEEPHA